MSSGNSSFTGVVNQAVSLSTLNVGTLTASSSTSSAVHVPSSSISGAVTLTAADSGRLLAVTNPSSSGYVIELPEPADGLVYDFVVAALTPGGYKISTGTPGVQYGGVTVVGSASASGLAISGGNLLTFTSTVAIGDRVKLQSDGTNWYVSGFMAASNAITS